MTGHKVTPGRKFSTGFSKQIRAPPVEEVCECNPCGGAVFPHDKHGRLSPPAASIRFPFVNFISFHFRQKACRGFHPQKESMTGAMALLVRTTAQSGSIVFIFLRPMLRRSMVVVPWDAKVRVSTPCSVRTPRGRHLNLHLPCISVFWFHRECH
jgi:hypothetical protein